MKVVRAQSRLVSSAELEMHWIARLSLPVASPFKSRFAKNCDHRRIHVPRGSLLVRLRIQVDRNSPGVTRKLAAGALRTKCEAAAEAGYLPLQSGVLNAIEHAGEDVGQQFMAGNRANAL